MPRLVPSDGRRRDAVYRGKPARHLSRLVELVQTDSYQLTERLTKTERWRTYRGKVPLPKSLPSDGTVLLQ